MERRGKRYVKEPCIMSRGMRKQINTEKRGEKNGVIQEMQKRKKERRNKESSEAKTRKRQTKWTQLCLRDVMEGKNKTWRKKDAKEVANRRS